MILVFGFGKNNTFQHTQTAYTRPLSRIAKFGANSFRSIRMFDWRNIWARWRMCGTLLVYWNGNRVWDGKNCGRWSRADREEYCRLNLFRMARWMCFLLQYTIHTCLYFRLYVAVAETLNKVSNLNSSRVPLNYIIITSLCLCTDKGANCVLVRAATFVLHVVENSHNNNLFGRIHFSRIRSAPTTMSQMKWIECFWFVFLLNKKQSRCHRHQTFFHFAEREFG